MSVENAENYIKENNSNNNYITVLDKYEQSSDYSVEILRKSDNALIDISSLVTDVTHSTSMADACGKLTFMVQKDPNGVLNTIENGDKVFFRRGNLGIFCGYVFTVGSDATEIFKITAYDSTRYLKNEDNFTIQNNETVSQIFERICVENQLPYRILTPINFVPPAKQYQGKTLYSIIKDCIRAAEVDVWQKSDRKTSVKYFIRDNYGVIELLSADLLLTNIEIGNESLLSSYTFETSIDKNTYNSIMIIKKNNVEGAKKEGKTTVKNGVVYVQPDSPSIAKWGKLQKVFELDENINEAQAKQKAQDLLRLYCKETKTLSLSCLGILGMNAGTGFKFNVPSLGKKLNMFIKEATHKYTRDFHTMDLTTNANDVDIYFR